VDEQAFISAMEGLTATLGQLALHTLAPDDPMAFPEPPDAEEIAEYERDITAARNQVDADLHKYLSMSLRDYRAGYPDRAGAYLVELLEKLQADPTYAQNVSEGAKRKISTCLLDLREI